MSPLKSSGLSVSVIEFAIPTTIGFSKGSSLIKLSVWKTTCSRCVDSIVKILHNTAQTIVFTVDDVAISRVEFIIRRCNGVSTTSPVHGSVRLSLFFVDLSKLRQMSRATVSQRNLVQLFPHTRFNWKSHLWYGLSLRSWYYDGCRANSYVKTSEKD